MPIKGLTEKRRLPRLGKIHLGIKVANAEGKEYPQKVDYFVCPLEVQQIHGNKPKALRILIPVEDEEKWASQYYRCYSKTRGLICKGDGATCIRLVNSQTGEIAWKEDIAGGMGVMKEAPCLGRECADYKVKCREIMNLQFLLPDVPGLGVWQIDTSSINSILNINNEAAFIKAAYGRISGLPLTLTLEPHQGRTPDRKMVTVYVLHLRTQLLMSEMMALAAKTTEQVILELPAGDDEIPELLIPENQQGYNAPAIAQEGQERILIEAPGIVPSVTTTTPGATAVPPGFTPVPAEQARKLLLTNEESEQSEQSELKTLMVSNANALRARGLNTQKKVVDFLSAFGFKTLVFDKLTLAEQRELAKRLVVSKAEPLQPPARTPEDIEE